MDINLRLVLAQHDEPKLPDQAEVADPVTDGGGGETAPGTPGTGQGPGPRQETVEPSFNPMIMILLIMGVFLVFMMGGQRKEKKKRAQLLASLKKGDKVQTVGGVLGTVVELRDTEIVLKVDENANTRIKFSRSAIQSVISERSESE